MPPPSQTVVQPETTALNIGNPPPSNMPFKCVEAYLSADTVYGGTDYGAAISAAVQASSLTSPTQLRVCVHGDHPVYTTGLFDRPIAFHMDGQSRLIPQSTMSSAPIRVTGATATGGSMRVTVPSASGIAVNMAVGGIGIPPGAYVTGISGTTVSISLPATLQFYGMATFGSAAILGVSSVSGLAAGQALNGVNNWPFNTGVTTIRSINYASNTITASTGATFTTSTPTTFVVGGSWTTNLTFVKTTPVLSFIHNQNALLDNFGQMYGSSLHQIWIEDISGLSPSGPNHTDSPGYPGVTGVQIVGYDQFVSYDLHVVAMQGAGLTLGGTASEVSNGGFFSAVRESSFYGDQIRNSGDAKTGQAELVIMTPRENNQVAADEINEINFVGGHYVYANGPTVNIGTYNNAHTGNRGPGSINFAGDFQIEGWSVNAGIAGQADSVIIQRADDIRFRGGEIAVPGQGKALIRADTVFYLNVEDCHLIPLGQNTEYQVAVVNSSTIGTFVSGGGREGKFSTTQMWDGMGVIMGRTNMWLAPLSPVNDTGTTITLASPWTGKTGTVRMVAGFGGVFAESSQAVGHISLIPSNWTPLDSESLAFIGNPASTFYVGAAFTSNTTFTQDSFNRLRFTQGPTQYFSTGANVDTSMQGIAQGWFKSNGVFPATAMTGEMDFISIANSGSGGHCFFNVLTGGKLGNASQCFTPAGGLNLTGRAIMPELQLQSRPLPTCNSLLAGEFIYTQGNSTTKDQVQVCAHDASNIYAWRTIY